MSLVIFFFSSFGFTVSIYFVRFLVCLLPATYLAHLILLDIITLKTPTQSHCLLHGFLHYGTVHAFQIQRLSFDVLFFIVILNTFQERSWGQNEPFCMLGWSWCDCERKDFPTTNASVRFPSRISVTADSKSVTNVFVGRHSADPSSTLLHQKYATYWTNRRVYTTWVLI